MFEKLLSAEVEKLLNRELIVSLKPGEAMDMDVRVGCVSMALERD